MLIFQRTGRYWRLPQMKSSRNRSRRSSLVECPLLQLPPAIQLSDKYGIQLQLILSPTTLIVNYTHKLMASRIRDLPHFRYSWSTAEATARSYNIYQSLQAFTIASTIADLPACTTTLEVNECRGVNSLWSFTSSPCHSPVNPDKIKSAMASVSSGEKFGTAQPHQSGPQPQRSAAQP